MPLTHQSQGRLASKLPQSLLSNPTPAHCSHLTLKSFSIFSPSFPWRQPWQFKVNISLFTHGEAILVSLLSSFLFMVQCKRRNSWVETTTQCLVPHELQLSPVPENSISWNPRWALPWLRKQGTEIHRSFQSFHPIKTFFLWLWAICLCPKSMYTQIVLNNMWDCYRHRQQKHSTGLGGKLMLRMQNENCPSSFLGNNWNPENEHVSCD